MPINGHIFHRSKLPTTFRRPISGLDMCIIFNRLGAGQRASVSLCCAKIAGIVILFISIVFGMHLNNTTIYVI